MRVINTFLAVFFAQTIALAVCEGFGGMHIDPFHSRKALFWATVAISVGAAILRWKFSRPRPAQAKPEQASPSPGGAARGTSRNAAQGTRAFDNATFAPGTKAMDELIAAAARATTAAPPAPPSRRASEMIAAAARQAIVFRQYFPPIHDPSHRSFFGGAPIVPRGFDWPRSAEGRPYHFLLQVDCAAVPEANRLGAFPDRGVLCFFMDFEETATGGFRVLHADTRGDDWEVASPPADLAPAFRKHAEYHWAWVQKPEQAPVLMPKWPFEPVAIELPEPVREEDDDESSPALWPGATAELVRAQGDEVASDYFSIKDLAAGDSLRRPFPAFPHDWRALQICSAKLVSEAGRARRFPQMSHFRDLGDEEKDARLAQIIEEAQSWFDRAASQRPFEAVPGAESDAFWEFLDRNAGFTRYGLADSLTLTIESSLSASAEAAARVPSEVAARIRSRHALAVTAGDHVHTNIPDRMLAPPVDIQGNQWERAQTHLLLLEISSNDGISHNFGEGVYQFWITPDDLLAARFDRVELTSDAY